MVCRGCEASFCSYSSPHLDAGGAGGSPSCHLLLKTIATAALLSPFLVQTLLQEELPDWTTLTLTVLLPPLGLALTLSATFLVIPLTHLVLPRVPPLLHLLLFLSVGCILGFSFASARWLLGAVLLLLVDGAFIAILERCLVGGCR